MLSALSLLVLILVANGAPVLGHVLLRDRLAWPLDFGLRLPDGQPVLGDGKTIRGVVLSLGATTACAWGIGLPLLTGSLVASAAMLGDSLSSFIKRRLGKKSGSRVLGLDQIPESLLPLLVVRNTVALSAPEVLTTMAAFVLAELALSSLLYPLGFRKPPY